MILWLMSIAGAQSLGLTVQGPIMQPADVLFTSTARTIGSPAILKHKRPGLTTLYWMFYETEIAGASAGCPAGEWGIGLAWSVDTTNWFQISFPIIDPTNASTDGTFYTCVAAHPTVVPLSDSEWMIYFKAEQDPATCPPGAPWGCDRYTGVGRFILEHVPAASNDYQYQLIAPDPEPILQSVNQDMGYPSVVFQGGEYHMMFAQNPDIFVSSSPLPNAFTVPASPVLTAGTTATGWAPDEMFMPSLTCDGTNYRAFIGGRTWDPYPTLADQSMGSFSSADLATWVEEPGPHLSTTAGDAEWRHMDAQRSVGGEYGFWFAQPVGAGNSLFLATTPGFDIDFDVKRCP